MNDLTISHPFKKRLWMGLALIIIGGLLLYFFQSIQGKGKSAKATTEKALPVVTATAQLDNVDMYLSGLGTVTPLSTVTVKTRVDGEIMKMYFQEGQMVKNGELLAEIDSRPYKAALTQAEGQLMRDKALLADAKRDLARYQTLLKQDSIAAQQVDTQQALVQQYEGTVKIDEGLLATAKLNLDYTKIIAPISGRVGLRQVGVGNIVHSSDPNGIVIITQLQPMSVLFSLPEDHIPQLIKKIKTDKKIRVNAFDRAFKEKITSGLLQTIDNQIDPSTGMVKLRAEFTNDDASLFPNQFVNVQLLLETRKQVVTIPSAAIQYAKAQGQENSFVFVVNKDNIVQQRNVAVGTAQANKSEIVSGLNNGEVVVVDGIDKLRDGTKVEGSHLTGNPSL